MANIKSQIKRNRQNEKRRVRNKAVRSEMKTRTKRAEDAVTTGADSASNVDGAQSGIDSQPETGAGHSPRVVVASGCMPVPHCT